MIMQIVIGNIFFTTAIKMNRDIHLEVYEISATEKRRIPLNPFQMKNYNRFDCGMVFDVQKWN